MRVPYNRESIKAYRNTRNKHLSYTYLLRVLFYTYYLSYIIYYTISYLSYVLLFSLLLLQKFIYPISDSKYCMSNLLCEKTQKRKFVSLDAPCPECSEQTDIVRGKIILKKVGDRVYCSKCGWSQ